MITQLYLGGVSAYLVEEKGAFMLVDTGGYLFLDKGEMNNRRELLEEKLKVAGVTKDNLKLLILTHGDADHCMNAKYLVDTYRIPVAMHEADVKMVSNPDLELLLKTVNYKKLGMKIVAKLIYGVLEKQILKTMNDFEKFQPDILFKGGERLDDYGFSASIIHLPGHTPGSIGIAMDSGEAIVGDAGPQTINAVDFKEFDESLQKLEKAQYKTLYTGHMKEL